MSHPNVLDNENAVLVVVDLQDPLLRVIHERDRVVANSRKLVEAAKVLSVPVIVTVQNSARLGVTTAEVAEAIPPDAPCFDKMTFSCMGCDDFVQALDQTRRRQVVLCGIETHVCVSQTAHDLLAHGYIVHVAKDAVSSRTEENWKTGVEKMRDSGCVITSTETAIFELVKDASRPEFKQILPIVK